MSRCSRDRCSVTVYEEKVVAGGFVYAVVTCAADALILLCDESDAGSLRLKFFEDGSADISASVVDGDDLYVGVGLCHQ